MRMKTPGAIDVFDRNAQFAGTPGVLFGARGLVRRYSREDIRPQGLYQLPQGLALVRPRQRFEKRSRRFQAAPHINPTNIGNVMNVGFVRKDPANARFEINQDSIQIAKDAEFSGILFYRGWSFPSLGHVGSGWTIPYHGCWR